MKLTVIILVLGSIFLGCSGKKMSSETLTSISVVREMEKNLPKHPIAVIPTTSNPIVPTTIVQPKYHIIVASFSTSEKGKAEKLTAQLKAKDYPATLLYSSQRYRVSIESFLNETDANTARDEYRSITDRNDIWVHKTE